MISGRLYEYRRMSDQALISYAYNLKAEVEHSAQGEAEWVCPEEEFTRIVLEKLADEGTLTIFAPISGGQFRLGKIHRINHRIFYLGYRGSNPACNNCLLR